MEVMICSWYQKCFKAFVVISDSVSSQWCKWQRCQSLDPGCCSIASWETVNSRTCSVESGIRAATHTLFSSRGRDMLVLFSVFPLGSAECISSLCSDSDFFFGASCWNKKSIGGVWMWPIIRDTNQFIRGIEVQHLAFTATPASL